jgi:hypothetical protein
MKPKPDMNMMKLASSIHDMGCGKCSKAGLLLGLATVQYGTKVVKMTTKIAKNDLCG